MSETDAWARRRAALAAEVAAALLAGRLILIHRSRAGAR